MTAFDFAAEHPIWTLVYLIVLGWALRPFVKVVLRRRAS